MYCVELQHIVVGEGVEVKPFDCSGVEHDQRQLFDAICVVRIAKLNPQRLEAVRPRYETDNVKTGAGDQSTSGQRRIKT